MGMRLAGVDSSIEDGWLRSTATLGTVTFQVGGDSLANANEWRWADGTLFWQGTGSGSAPSGVYAAWNGSHGEPLRAPGCVGLQLVEAWAALDCTGTLPYVCERY